MLMRHMLLWLVLIYLNFGNCVASSNLLTQVSNDGEVISLEVVIKDRAQIQAKHVAADGSCIDEHIVSSSEREVITLPQIEMNSMGDSVVVWQSVFLLKNLICLEVSAYIKGIGWSDPLIITNELQRVEPGNYTVKLSEEGSVIIVWTAIESNKSTPVYKSLSINMLDLFS